jgi:secreted PhoX family phosphatase
MPGTLDRRSFISRSAAVAGGGVLSVTALERPAARDAADAAGRRGGRHPYGPLQRKPHQRGVEVLALPAGFSYVTFSHTGSTMSDGTPTPLALDGMSAFRGRSRRYVRLVRNSEDRNLPGQGSVGGDPAAKYDPAAGGGTTTLVHDEHRRRLVSDFGSLNGTTVNCAGGHGLGERTWITAEETVGGPEATDEAMRFPKRHGYLFEVPVRRGPGELRKGTPIRAAGRFQHEAVAVDPRTGAVYETEDPSSGRSAGFYRYFPYPGERTSAKSRWRA